MNLTRIKDLLGFSTHSMNRVGTRTGLNVCLSNVQLQLEVLLSERVDSTKILHFSHRKAVLTPIKTHLDYRLLPYMVKIHLLLQDMFSLINTEVQLLSFPPNLHSSPSSMTWMLPLTSIIAYSLSARGFQLQSRTIQTAAVCSSDFSWTDNSLNQTACYVAALVDAPCNEDSAY